MRPPLLQLRSWLGLPPQRFRSCVSTTWVPASDGTRLATTVALPEAGGNPLPAVLVRTHLPAHRRAQPGHLLANLLAGRGFAAVVQECRGRSSSEGRFTPFGTEADDGSDAVAWVSAQPWFDGRLALFGLGYAGFCAWAALARARHPVHALAVAFAARDPHALLYPGGALALEVALRWGLGLGEREPLAEKELDIARAVGFRPLVEADRVAVRETSWYRDWLRHPGRDAFWDAVVPPLPEAAPPLLSVAGWNHPQLDAQLADWMAVDGACGRNGRPRPELVIGPWPRGRFGFGPLGECLRRCVAFLERHLRDGPAATARVRIFSGGTNRWWEGPEWPPAGASPRRFHLRSEGRANGAGGDGQLEAAAPVAGEPPDRFSYDPSDPVPTCDGRRGSRGPPSPDQRPVEARADVLCYSSAPLERELEVCGPVRAVLFASSSAPDTDFTAKLVDVDRDGVARSVCDGVLRCRARAETRDAWLEPGEVARLEIDLGAASHGFAAGHRLRLEVSSSNFPRFDRHPNARVEPARADTSDCALARQSVYHDPVHASYLELTAT